MRGGCNCMLWKHIAFVCMPVCLHLFVLWVREPCLSLLAWSFSFSYIRANGSMPGRNMLRTRHGAGERSLYGSVRLLARCPLVWITLSFVHLKCYKVWTLCHCGMTWLTLTIIPLPLSLYVPNSNVCWHNRWLYKEEFIFLWTPGNEAPCTRLTMYCDLLPVFSSSSSLLTKREFKRAAGGEPAGTWWASEQIGSESCRLFCCFACA